MLMDSSRTYSEEEVNELLQEWNRDVAPAIATDHVSIRRTLVDFGFLERRADGSVYQVGFPPKPVAFEREVEDLELKATVSAYRDY